MHLIKLNIPIINLYMPSYAGRMNSCMKFIPALYVQYSAPLFFTRPLNNDPLAIGL